MSVQDIQLFQEKVWAYYAAHGRHELPWRLPKKDGSFDPYKILVSEVMLQQTQVLRVIPKFLAFIGRFPSFSVLAGAPLSEVLKEWSGLGYNRRAKFLWQTAQKVVSMHQGSLPRSQEELVALPGIGPNTAGAILAYAYNQPVIFIETNIRTVFIHHFFPEAEQVADKELRALISETAPQDEARNWYWALMDYGTHLKQSAGNASQRSAHYMKQSRFEGSKRQIRGWVLRTLAEEPTKKAKLVKDIPDVRLVDVLEELQAEGFIEEKRGRFQLHGS